LVSFVPLCLRERFVFLILPSSLWPQFSALSWSLELLVF
jgi:hypothetical protein